MTQQEIKENLPQLPLQTYYAFGSVVDHEGRHILATNTEYYPAETDSAVDHAIVHAINNTYGKGINPESVREMYSGLNIAIGAIQAIGDDVTAKILKDILSKAAL